MGGLEPRRLVARERQEHLALLARWYYSGSRDGEWLPFAALSELPYRRLVRAISRTAGGGKTGVLPYKANQRLAST